MRVFRGLRSATVDRRVLDAVAVLAPEGFRARPADNHLAVHGDTAGVVGGCPVGLATRALPVAGRDVARLESVGRLARECVAPGQVGHVPLLTLAVLVANDYLRGLVRTQSVGDRVVPRYIPGQGVGRRRGHYQA